MIPRGPGQRVCAIQEHIAVRNLTALLFAVNRTVCVERLPPSRTTTDGHHYLYTLNPNSDAVVRSLQCVQQGEDGVYTHWRCEGHSASHVSVFGFGDMHIRCEGWGGPNDAYVRAHACFLEYDIVMRPQQHHQGMTPNIVEGYATGSVY